VSREDQWQRIRNLVSKLRRMIMKRKIKRIMAQVEDLVAEVELVPQVARLVRILNREDQLNKKAITLNLNNKKNPI
jgi:hypothetical protein